VNLGAGWTNGTGMTENSLTCDGVLTKISEDVEFQHDKNNYMRPWMIHSKDSDRIRLTFSPIYERFARTDVLILTSAVHRMLGYFEGIITPPDRRVIHANHLIAWAEDHHARW
jgi:hypothetical protein